MAGTIASTAILTQGLTCGLTNGCEFGALITTPFDLYCRLQRLVRRDFSGGGPYPYPAWNRFEPGEIHKFYKPIDTIDELTDLFKPLQKSVNATEPFYIIPYDQLQQYINVGDRKNIVIDIMFADQHKTTSFSVPKKKRGSVEITSMSASKITARVSSVKKKGPRIRGTVKKKGPRVKVHSQKPSVTKIRNKYEDD